MLKLVQCVARLLVLAPVTGDVAGGQDTIHEQVSSRCDGSISTLAFNLANPINGGRTAVGLHQTVTDPKIASRNQDWCVLGGIMSVDQVLGGDSSVDRHCPYPYSKLADTHLPFA